MEYKSLKPALFIFTLGFAFFPISFVFANAGGGGGSSGESGEAKEVAKKIPESEDWAKQVTILNTKEGKMKAYTREIQDLIKKKKKTKIRSEKLSIIDQMIQAHTDLRKEAEGYNEMRNRIKYRFPNKGEVAERHYSSVRVQSLEQMEKEEGLDAHLTQLKLKIDQKYKVVVENETKDLSRTESRSPASEESKPDIYKRITIER